MLRIAIQSKGRLYEESMALLEEAGIRIPGREEDVVGSCTKLPRGSVVSKGRRYS